MPEEAYVGITISNATRRRGTVENDGALIYDQPELMISINRFWPIKLYIVTAPGRRRLPDPKPVDVAPNWMTAVPSSPPAPRNLNFNTTLRPELNTSIHHGLKDTRQQRRPRSAPCRPRHALCRPIFPDLLPSPGCHHSSACTETRGSLPWRVRSSRSLVADLHTSSFDEPVPPRHSQFYRSVSSTY